MAKVLVYLSNRPEFLYRQDCTVLETYCFGDGVEAAAYVDVPDDADLLDDARVVGVEEPMTVEPLYEPAFVSEEPDDVATIEDVRRLHRVPAGEGTGAGVTVVVMDSGIDASHPVFDDVTIREVDVTGDGSGDAVGHGTAVAGQVALLAPEADIVSLRIFGGEGQTATNVVLRAYEWLHANVGRYDVVNMSWGGRRRSPNLDRVHDALVEKGVRDVVAAGNTGERSGSPATADRAFSVGACTVDGRMAEFSSYNPEGDNPDVTAIGKDNRLAQATGTALGTDLPGRWVKASGTSFASPEVAGMVAKLLSLCGETPPVTVMRAFEASARDIPDQPRDGAGLADYRGALEAVRSGSLEVGEGSEEGEEGDRAVVARLGGRTLAVFDGEAIPEGEYAVEYDDADRGWSVRFLPVERADR
ncbi:S8 family serine peptidase [Halomarina halobia]|uniref:S8 family serine peptidase n=1 Tax=Halomarina halobia TaxID=3033386 RepID=A0ABD6A5D5_9EURY|nr:S8 family serine peptidase [Halomarina sp. PSR21]